MQVDLNAMLASTNSILEAILRRNFVPHALRAKPIQGQLSLPGTPTGEEAPPSIFTAPVVAGGCSQCLF